MVLQRDQTGRYKRIILFMWHASSHHSLQDVKPFIAAVVTSFISAPPSLDTRPPPRPHTSPCLQVLFTPGLWVPLVNVKNVFILPGIPKLFQAMITEHQVGWGGAGGGG